MNEIEIFGSFLGLVLNRNKAEGIWIGKLKNCKLKVLNRHRIRLKHKVNTLGITRKNVKTLTGINK